MLYHILAVGDVVMEPGLRHLERHLRPLQKWKAIDFTVVNGENAAGVGLTRDQAERIYDAGADVVTLGNHAFGKSQIADFLEDAPWLLRPANYTGRAPGRGCGVYDLGGVRIRVLNLIGRCADTAMSSLKIINLSTEFCSPGGIIDSQASTKRNPVIYRSRIILSRYCISGYFLSCGIAAHRGRTVGNIGISGKNLRICCRNSVFVIYHPLGSKTDFYIGISAIIGFTA